MEWRNRWTFWALAITVIALISVPSIEWLGALRDYADFASGWEPSPLKPTRTTFTPRESRADDAPELKPVEFRHRAPKAKSVEVVGDFNAWKPGLLKMKRGADGVWRLVVPVPVGRHKYLFLTDGQPQVDAKAETATGPEGRRVSIRSVK